MQLLAGTLASAKLPQRRPSLSTAAGARDVISDVIVRHLYNIKSVRLHRPITTERKTLPHGQLFHEQLTGGVVINASVVPLNWRELKRRRRRTKN